MALNIVELFGYSPTDSSRDADDGRKKRACPFTQKKCTKTFSDKTISGACTVKQANGRPVICCPNRLYDSNYKILKEVAEASFGSGVRLIGGDEVAKVAHDGKFVAVFGKGWGKELRLPQRSGRGGYFVDWVLALIGVTGRLQEFVAVEIQAIDTTGNYRAEQASYMKGRTYSGSSKAGLNWENVSKRILPQIIYKGHVLRRETLCTKGLFFICPSPVYEKIHVRLGGHLYAYTLQPGALTFRWYDVGPDVPNGSRRALIAGGQFTTTIDQVALAFTSPSNLPPAGVYQVAIESELEHLQKRG